MDKELESIEFTKISRDYQSNVLFMINIYKGKFMISSWI